MAKKKHVVTNAMRILTAKKIPFKAYEYEADEVGDNFGCVIAELIGTDPAKTYKTLVGKGDKTGVIVAVIPVNNEVNLKKLASESGNKSVQLIHVKELLSLTGYIRGGVSPIGMKKQYPTYVNNSCLQQDVVYVSGGVCGISLEIRTEDFISATGAVACEIV